MENTLDGLIGYFRTLTTQHVELKSFVHGTARRVVNGSRTTIQYPALWLETPALALTDKDGMAPNGQRQFGLVVVDTVRAGDDVAEDAAWARTERLLLDVLIRLRNDRRAEGIQFTLAQSSLEPVTPLSAANEIGFRIELALDKPVAFCYDPSRWTS